MNAKCFSSSFLLVILFFEAATAASFFQPEELRSVDGKLDVTLNVARATTLDGRRDSAVFNGNPTGPTIRVKPGDVLSVTLNNNLDPGSDLDRELYAYTHDVQNEIDNYVNVTIIYNRLNEIGNTGSPTYGYWGLNYVNLHFHGADFDPKIESVDDALDGGESKTYVFQIPEDQDPGLMWYHNHFHGTTAHAYLSGLYGLMVIEGTAQDVAQAPGIKDATEVFLIIGEFFNIPDTTKPYPELPLAYSFDWISLTNGHDGATTKFQFEAGEVVLFRAASATVEPTIRISIDGHKMISVAYEGFSVPALKEVDTLDIGGGQRVEFLVRFDAPGTFVMRRARWATGLNITGPASCGLFFGSPTERCLNYDVARTIGTIEILPSDTAEASMEPLIDSIELPGINAYHQELAVRAPVANKTINFQFETTFPLFQIPYDGPFVPPGFGFGINDVLYTPFHSLGTVQTGTCETWEIISVPLPGVEHPFHIHQADFMVTHEDGVLLEKPVWRDTVIIYGKSVTIHVCFDRAMPGDRLPIHCHMASHQDIGGIGMYDVIGRVFSSPDTSVEIAMDTLVPAAPAAKPTLAPAAPIPKPVSSPPMPTVTSAPLTVQPVVPISKTSGEKMKKKKSKKMMQKISSDSSSSSFSSSSSEDGGSLRGAN